MKREILVFLNIFFLLIFMIGIISGADWTPQGNISLRNTYYILNAPYYNGTNINITGWIISGGYNLTNLFSTAEPFWNSNYSTFLTHITWANAVNGTLMQQANWNATNTSYYLQTNPFGFYNSTNPPPADAETLWNANYSVYLTKPTWAQVINGTAITMTTGAYAINDSLWSLNYSNFSTIYGYVNNGTFHIEGNELTDVLNWTKLQNYPVSCPSDTFVTQIGDTITCTAINEALWNANYSTYLTKPTWAQAMNNTLMQQANWNATNTSYYLTTNPFAFYNITTAPIYLNDTFRGTNYSTFLTHMPYSAWNATNTSYIRWIEATNGTLMPYSAWNATNTSYYLASNPNSYISTWTEVDPKWTANYSTFLTHMPYSAWNSTNTSYYLQTNPFAFYNLTTIPNYLLTTNWNATNTSYYLATNPFAFYNSTNPPPADAETLWNANYSVYLTKPTYAQVTNGTLLMKFSDWNSTNTSYYLQTNPFSFYNITTAPIYLNDTFRGTNYSTFLTLMPYSAWNATNTSYFDLNKANTVGAFNQTFDTSTLFIDSVSNRVGIGTASPSQLLQVQGGDILLNGTAPILRVQALTGNNATIHLQNGGNIYYIKGGAGGGTGGGIRFYQNGVSGSDVVFTGDGKVGIGTTSPSDVLTVVGNVNVSGCVELSNGTIIGGSCVSDISTKDKVKDYNINVSKLLLLSPKEFEYKNTSVLAGVKKYNITETNETTNKTTTKEITENVYYNFPSGVQKGFIADEVALIYPEFVETDEYGFKRVIYGQNWIFEIWKQNQEQQNIINQLNATLTRICTNNPLLCK